MLWSGRGATGLRTLPSGAGPGLALEIVCFSLWSILGLQQQLWLWPLLVAVIFVAVPRLRRHWRISSPQPLPRLWSWGVASAIAACTLTVRESAFAAPLPPAGGFYDQDITWHLSIVHELTRSFPPQVPQVVGRSFATTGSPTFTWQPRTWCREHRWQPLSCGCGSFRCSPSRR